MTIVVLCKRTWSPLRVSTVVLLLCLGGLERDKREMTDLYNIKEKDETQNESFIK